MSRPRRRTSFPIEKALGQWVKQAQEGARRTPRPLKELLTAARASLRDMAPQPASRRRRGRSGRTAALIQASSRILGEIQPASVRAVCYRLFVEGVIASMAKNETNRVSAQLARAREEGLIPWAWIVDETREPERVSAWEDPAAFIKTVQRSYRRDRWTDQPARLEVWSEKSTVKGTLAPVLHEYGLTFRVNHGYGSATAIHQAAQDSRRGDKLLTVFYVGDYDPSGLHMSAVDLPRRIKGYGGVVDLIRVALTEQDTAGLPSFATESKRRDPRCQWYSDRYGARCWELDALSPVSLRDRVEQAILQRLDRQAWERAEITERAECDSLANILNAWPGLTPPPSNSGQASKC